MNDYALIVVHLHLIIFVHITKKPLGNEIEILFYFQNTIYFNTKFFFDTKVSYLWRHLVTNDDVLEYSKVLNIKYLLFLFIFLPRKCYLFNSIFKILFCTWKSETIRLWLSRTLQMTPTRRFQLKTSHNKSQI